MLRLTDLRLPLPDGPTHAEAELRAAAALRLGIEPERLLRLRVTRRSLDARKKNAALFLYTLDVELADEAGYLAARAAGEPGVAGVAPAPQETYDFPAQAPDKECSRPVVVGAGPCGLFAALALAQAGFRPLLLERGQAIAERARQVEAFWQDGVLDPHSNVQFGEGGAGAFSDGKLTTQIKDRRHRLGKVLTELAQAGAGEEILWQNRPHVGTDRLRAVVANLRKAILALGGEVRFGVRVVDLVLQDGALKALRLDSGEELPAERAIFAIGHSARDTFAMLHERGLRMEQKPFAIGARIEHPQGLIDRAQLGNLVDPEGKRHPAVGPADYKLVHHIDSGPLAGRSAYTFCMCPGGEVIASSSEPGGVVVNGMSFRARSGTNANSALLVGVTPQDMPSEHPLAGVEFQRRWERLAFAAGGGDFRALVQRSEDFLSNRPSLRLGRVTPSYRPGVLPGDLATCLPDYVCATMREAIPAMERRLRGFALPDAMLTGVETRSSSPVRLLRGPDLQSLSVRGLYPAGEGAGYAGGIVSSAVDGLRVAEALALECTGGDPTLVDAPDRGQE